MSRITLRRIKKNYDLINRKAFDGELPKSLRIISWREMVRIRPDVGKSYKTFYLMAACTYDPLRIAINTRPRMTAGEMRLHLIHEMVHISAPSLYTDCKREFFQWECFRVMCKMGWALL